MSNSLNPFNAPSEASNPEAMRHSLPEIPSNQGSQAELDEISDNEGGFPLTHENFRVTTERADEVSAFPFDLSVVNAIESAASVELFGLLIKSTDTNRELRLIERPDVNKLRVLLSTACAGLLSDSWTTKDRQKTFATELYKNERAQLEAYLKKVQQGETVEVVYKKGVADTDGYARVYPQKALGVTSMRKVTRNTLMRDRYVDFDLSNAQMAILRVCAERLQVSASAVVEYCEHKDAVRSRIALDLGVTEKQIKTLFLRLAFGGSFEAWARELSVPATSDFVSAFCSQTRRILEAILRVNGGRMTAKNPLWRAVSDKCKKSGKDVFRSWCATYCQAQEYKLVHWVIRKLMQDTGLCPNGDVVYQFDGIQLLRCKVDEFGGEGAVVDYLNRITAEYAGCRYITWMTKEWDAGHPLPENISVDDVHGSHDYEYETWKTEMEQAGRMFLYKPTLQICVDRIDEQFVFAPARSKLSFQSTMELMYGEDKAELYSEYFGDTTKRVVDKLVNKPFDATGRFEPPERWRVGPRELNTFTPPPLIMEAMTETPGEWSIEAQQAVRIFRDVMISNFNGVEEDAMRYLRLLAYTLQRPWEKTNVLTHFWGEGACGKTTVWLTLRALWPTQCVKTSSPEVDIFGAYNSAFVTKKYILIEEGEKTAFTKQNIAKLKDYIDAPTVELREKYMKSCPNVDLTASWLSATNTQDALVTHAKDRKFIITQSDLRFVREGPQDYVPHLACMTEVLPYYNGELLKREDVRRALLRYLCFELVVTDEEVQQLRNPKKRIITESQKTDDSQGRCPIELWMRYKLCNTDKQVLPFYSKELYQSFVEWYKEEYGEEPKSTSNEVAAKYYTPSQIGRAMRKYIKGGLYHSAIHYSETTRRFAIHVAELRRLFTIQTTQSPSNAEDGLPAHIQSLMREDAKRQEEAEVVRLENEVEFENCQRSVEVVKASENEQPVVVGEVQNFSGFAQEKGGPKQNPFARFEWSVKKREKVVRLERSNNKRQK